MKNLYILIILVISTLSCRSQTILPLEGPSVANKQNLSKPIFIKDINNVRDVFYGVWQGTFGNKELTLYIYKIDDALGQGLITDLFIDKLFGYYIYKENGVEVINSRSEAQIYNTPQNLNLAPFNGITSDGETINTMSFIDYGISIAQPDGSPSNGKGGIVNFTIIDNPEILTPQATFELKNRAGAGQRVILNGQTTAPYNYDFSIPTSMTLTKIMSTPPPL